MESQNNITEENNAQQEKELCKECQHCLEALELVLDKEATPEDMAYVKQHLETCTHCLECYEVDKTIRETLKNKLSKKCPNSVMDCIKQAVGKW